MRLCRRVEWGLTWHWGVCVCVREDEDDNEDGDDNEDEGLVTLCTARTSNASCLKEFAG